MKLFLKYFTENRIAFALLFLIGCCLIVLVFKNTMMEGGADNCWHYYFSKYSYKYPKFFFHHWGKPFFILLSAPFCQFGIHGLNIFNVLCGLLSAWTCFLFAKELGLKLPWMGIILTLFTPIYFLVIQSAMTEPLFSLMFITGSYLFYKEKWIPAAVLASFMIYSRTEGVFFLLIYGFYLVVVNKWKYIPFLATGFIMYSFAGYFAGHDLLWFFTENPYSPESPYGHGTWKHFFIKYEFIFGVMSLILLSGGLLIILFNIIKEKEFMQWPLKGSNIRVFILVVIPAAVFFMFHVYAWALGKYGSAGLERVFACIMPATALVGLYTVDLIVRLRFYIYFRSALVVLILFYSIKDTFTHNKYPLVAFGSDKVSRDAAKWFVKIRKPGELIYYAHPGIVFNCDYDPFDPLNKECFGLPSDCNFKSSKPFYYLWDSQFSEFSCGQKLDVLKGCSNFKCLKVFRHMDYSLYIFEYIPG